MIYRMNFTRRQWLVVILLLFLLSFSLAWIVLNVKITVRAQGITASLPNAVFFIPSEQPLKVYLFDPNPSKLQEIVNKNVANSPATFGIFIKNLSTGQETTLNPDEQFTSASLFKLSIMYTIYKKGAEGKLDINKPDIRNNLHAMITYSSNEASYYLIDNYTSWNEVTDYVQAIGMKDTSLRQSPPTTTPRDIARLLELIAMQRAVDKESSNQMFDLLMAQKINDRIPVYLPEDVNVAHKTGEFNDVRHDAGIVISPENDYIIVLMSKNSKQPESVKPIMAQLSLDIYEFFKTQWENAPEIL